MNSRKTELSTPQEPTKPGAAVRCDRGACAPSIFEALGSGDGSGTQPRWLEGGHSTLLTWQEVIRGASEVYVLEPTVCLLRPEPLKIALWLLAESEWRREDVSDQSITSRKASDIDLTSRLRLAAELRSTQITDDDLSMTFGPQWEAIVALVRRCAALTESEAVALDAAWDARAAARDAAWAAARGTAWDAAWDAAWAAARDAARDAARPATRPAVRAAMCALVVRDLITDDGFTQAHYDLLTGPWSEVIGKVHPDDTTVKDSE